MDSDLEMRTHVQRTVSHCFATLRQLRSIHRSVPPSTMQTLVVNLVLSRLDYGNAALGGLPIYLQRWLKSVLNASARLIYDLRRSDHITDALASHPVGAWWGPMKSSVVQWRPLRYYRSHRTPPDHIGPPYQSIPRPMHRTSRGTIIYMTFLSCRLSWGLFTYL